MIPFSKPTVTGYETEHVAQAIESGYLSGDGPFTKKCHQWFEEHLKCEKALLTPSCTAALEMAAILIDIQPGDEVIMPSYTFVSTANAFVLRGAKIVFIDIRPDTMNIDENLIEQAITLKTKAIVPVHYAGVACDMDKIMEIAEKHKLYVIEDAAQGMMSSYRGKPLGTIGHFGTFSFHATKNYTSGGEGGLLIINDSQFFERSEIIREKGTNRSQYVNGIVDKYKWVDLGSSYLPSEIQSAFLYPQLLQASIINESRLDIWFYYYSLFSSEPKGYTLPYCPKKENYNAHAFYLVLDKELSRKRIISKLKDFGVTCTSHFEPLHLAEASNKHATFIGQDVYTTELSNRILRLPLYHSLSREDALFVYGRVIHAIKEGA